MGEVNRQLKQRNRFSPRVWTESRRRTWKSGLHVKQDSWGRLKPTHGYSVHTGVDENDFIHLQTVTAGQGHDSRERDTLLLWPESRYMPT